LNKEKAKTKNTT